MSKDSLPTTNRGIERFFVPTSMLVSGHPVAQAWRWVDDALDSLGELPDEEPSALAARLMAASETLKSYWRDEGLER